MLFGISIAFEYQKFTKHYCKARETVIDDVLYVEFPIGVNPVNSTSSGRATCNWFLAQLGFSASEWPVSCKAREMTAVHIEKTYHGSISMRAKGDYKYSTRYGLNTQQLYAKILQKCLQNLDLKKGFHMSKIKIWRDI